MVKAKIDFMAKCESYMHKLKFNEKLVNIFAKGKKGIEKLKKEHFFDKSKLDVFMKDFGTNSCEENERIQFNKKFWREPINFREDLEEKKEVVNPQKGIFTANAVLEDCESGSKDFEGVLGG